MTSTKFSPVALFAAIVDYDRLNAPLIALGSKKDGETLARQCIEQCRADAPGALLKWAGECAARVTWAESVKDAHERASWAVQLAAAETVIKENNGPVCTDLSSTVANIEQEEGETETGFGPSLAPVARWKDGAILNARGRSEAVAAGLLDHGPRQAEHPIVSAHPHTGEYLEFRDGIGTVLVVPAHDPNTCPACLDVAPDAPLVTVAPEPYGRHIRIERSPLGTCFNVYVNKIKLANVTQYAQFKNMWWYDLSKCPKEGFSTKDAAIAHLLMDHCA